MLVDHVEVLMPSLDTSTVLTTDFRVRATQSASHPRAQRVAFHRRYVRQKCRSIGSTAYGDRTRAPTSLERAYAFPRVRFAVARLLLDFGMLWPASVAA